MNSDPFNGLMKPWLNAQKPMSTVIRWGNFPQYQQTLTEHNNAIPYVLMWVQGRLMSRLDIDWLLLAQAVQVHDQGEPLSGGDEHAENKTHDKDLQEYISVYQMMQGVEPEFHKLFMRAFLLQYVRKRQWWSQMSKDDQSVLSILAEKYHTEALIFEAIERLDYLASSVSGYAAGIRNQHETMIDHVLKNQVPKLDMLVGEWSPLSRVWSPDVRQKFLDLGSK